ncbi:hypothetical protein KL905_004957 [Ogataea polymorpha]|uniref:Uncharacterized protein n=1 Tax=Ogataea polymorpha TaxID=460523 RepID=A0A1B7SHR0_9ASCO|nr:uncharacterized protein OGAPODRAFT_94448 [Ogataea polymorpha]KAG7877040.1 hypothetical protein KL937_004971 [Ogataea polymorpha]KAG7888653.1 hypothetical protein KL908_005013 [Ogataea polymorpha]KAG7897562.1 hypothetical protein KL935_004992 [Ogataea polymorpha]KAG7898819.1 hypothetical protein KL907_005173 [Ogataea polymorpha]KAG7905361.1 hypothetical protein KL906_005216 [Ogataea polymorpha]
MSSEEPEKPGEEQVDDLFGDASDEEVVDEVAANVSDEEINDVQISADDDDDNEKEVEVKEPTRADISIPRHPRSHVPAGDAMVFSLPRYLFVDPEPFAPATFESNINEFLKDSLKDSTSKELQNSLEFKKLEVQNTIRWRYAKTSSDELYKQSNAAIVEWEDGSMSLKIGDEFFNIKLNNNEDEILVAESGDLYLPVTELKKSIQVLPSSTSSRAHKILANTLQSNLRLKKSKKINTIVTTEDPELKAKEMEKAQREIEKARRKQLAKLAMEEERQERESRTTSLAHSIDAAEDEDEQDDGEYNDKDDFVVSDNEQDSGLDDDELDKAAEKLRNVKRAGEAMYREKSQEVEEEEDDEGAVVRKKRRVVLDDEEDED